MAAWTKIYTENDTDFSTSPVMSVGAYQFFGNKNGTAGPGGAVTVNVLLTGMELDQRAIGNYDLQTCGWVASGALTTAGAISSGTWNGSTLETSAGGTGLSTGLTTANSLLVANTANVLTAITGSTANHCLIRGASDIGFGLVDVSTMTTGVLPISKGGTGLSAAMTTGDYIYVNASGSFAMGTATTIVGLVATADKIASNHNHDTSYLKKGSVNTEAGILGNMDFDNNALTTFGLLTASTAPSGSSSGNLYVDTNGGNKLMVFLD